MGDVRDDGTGIDVLAATEGVRLLGHLSRVVHLLHNRTRPVMAAASGLEGPEFELLLRLWQQPGHTAQAAPLGEAIGLTSSGTTRLVARALTKGLISREPDPCDGRAFLLRHTPLGREKLHLALDAHTAQLRELLAETLPPATTARLIEDLAHWDAAL
ncbi:MarR family winged helix-turn-helix transcriptional regulator [Streptomyces sp. NPDC093225]|uniref:MarR family winged helix-turn-helix transcriptional regulator n=1 Tax=Streptomyces sp. NPDC093225 TaxID=3366034 RepID=UPI0037FED013